MTTKDSIAAWSPTGVFAAQFPKACRFSLGPTFTSLNPSLLPQTSLDLAAIELTLVALGHPHIGSSRIPSRQLYVSPVCLFACGCKLLTLIFAELNRSPVQCAT